MNLKHLFYRFKYLYSPFLPLKVPVDISLELSSACNMSCSYCYHNDRDSLPFTIGTMDTNLAETAILQAADIGVNSIKFNYRGESTLHKDYTYLTGLSKALSNGSTFIDRLANSNFKIPKSIRDDKFIGLSNLTKVKISYDSFKKEVFEKQRHGGDHDLTTENIDLFYNHPNRIKSETQMVIQAVRTKLNKDEDIYSICKKKWPEADISIRDMVEGRIEKNLDEYKNKGRDFDNRKSCLQAHARLIVHHNGLVSPCCPSIKNDLIIGLFPETHLKDIFNSSLAKQLRKDLKSKKAFGLDPCKSCSSFESFKNYKPNFDS